MIELQVLKAFLHKPTWVMYRKYVKNKELTKELNVLLNVLDNYYIKHEDSLTLAEFEVVCETSGRTDKTHKAILETMKQAEVRPELVEQLLKSYKQKQILSQLALVSYDASEGRKNLEDVTKLVTQLDDVQTLQENTVEFTTDDLELLYEDAFAKPGLRWRLGALNRSLGSLRKGDFGFVFARPETGKTTFLCSEITYMSQQLDRPVLWINNEEQSNKVMLRCYQAALGLTNVDLRRDIPAARAQFHNLTKGNIKLFDAVNSSAADLERLCDEIQPGLIVLDQIDKIKGFTNDREDLRLGSIYQWAREIAKKYGPVIGITQADGSGENVRWLTMNNVANAKTSKQAEADWILGIGAIHDVGFEYVRFLHLSKNKLAGDEDSIPELRHGRLEVHINPAIARYEDMDG